MHGGSRVFYRASASRFLTAASRRATNSLTAWAASVLRRSNGGSGVLSISLMIAATSRVS